MERVKGIEPSYSAWKSDAFARFSKASSDKSQPNNSIDSKRQIIAVGSLLGLLLWRSPGLQPFSSRQAHGPSPALDLPRLAIDTNAFDQDGLVAHWRGNCAAACVGIDSCSRRRPSYARRADQMGGKREPSRARRTEPQTLRDLFTLRQHPRNASTSLPRNAAISPLIRQIAAHGATPQCCPIFGRGVPKTAIAPTTSSQNGTTPTPGIASRTSPGKSSHCQPSTTNNSAVVTTSTAHPIGGAKLANLGAQAPSFNYGVSASLLLDIS